MLVITSTDPSKTFLFASVKLKYINKQTYDAIYSPLSLIFVMNLMVSVDVKHHLDQAHLVSPLHRPPPPIGLSYLIFKTRSFYRLSLICSLASDYINQNELKHHEGRRSIIYSSGQINFFSEPASYQSGVWLFLFVLETKLQHKLGHPLKTECGCLRDNRNKNAHTHTESTNQSTCKTSHKHNNKDPTHLWQL